MLPAHSFTNAAKSTVAAQPACLDLGSALQRIHNRVILTVNDSGFMIDSSFLFKLGKQMPARELRESEHFSSPSINAVYITLFQSPGDIAKASQNALQSTSTICITQLGLQHDFENTFVFLSHPLQVLFLTFFSF